MNLDPAALKKQKKQILVHITDNYGERLYYHFDSFEAAVEYQKQCLENGMYMTSMRIVDRGEYNESIKI